MRCHLGYHLLTSPKHLLPFSASLPVPPNTLHAFRQRALGSEISLRRYAGWTTASFRSWVATTIIPKGCFIGVAILKSFVMFASHQFNKEGDSISPRKIRMRWWMGVGTYSEFLGDSAALETMSPTFLLRESWLDQVNYFSLDFPHVLKRNNAKQF